MQPFLRHAGREFHSIALDPPGRFTLPFAAAPYPCLIWDARGGWSEDSRAELLQAVLDTDARYAVCGGTDCERWHDELDQAFVLRYLDDELAADAHFLMTSWHTGASPEEVAFFFAYNTNFDNYDFQRFLVLCLGRDPGLQKRLEVALTLAVQDPERFMREHPATAG
jgi:hypothetical protein